MKLFNLTALKMPVLPQPALFALLFLAAAPALAQTPPPYRNPALPVEARVDDLLGRMRPEEKFWQLFMVAESWDLPKERYAQGAFGFEGGASDGKAEGQMIALSDSGSALGLAQRINAAQHFFVEKTRLGIPILPFAEALHGLVRAGATVFPQSIALAASFDTSLMRRVSGAIAAETRACGIRMVLSPVVNIADDPRWGRTEETYGEDPWLASAMGVAFVSEFEKAGVVTNPKHFVANSGPGGHDSYPIHYTERLLEELYFPPFKACIQHGGSRSVMAAYNSIDGTPCTASDWLLQQKLKKEWDFQGFVISDAGATGGSNCLHMTAKDYYESTVRAMNNGLDVIFQTDFNHYKLFQPPFLDGSIAPQAIDQALRRVLRAKFQLGLFDDPYVDTTRAAACFGRTSHRALAREAAQKSIVLLKNEGPTLPFSKSEKSVAVIGADAAEARLGGYSGPGFGKISILDGIRRALGDSADVRYAPGCGRAAPEYVPVPAAFLSQRLEGKTVAGLKGEYFNGIRPEGVPDLVRTDAAVDFGWTLYSPDPAINYDWFSVRWTGYLTFPETGRFGIGIEGNDGYRLYLDGVLVIDNWVKGSYRSILKDFAFEQGRPYAIRIEFFESSGSVRFRLVWKNPAWPTPEPAIGEAVETARSCAAIVAVVGIEEGEGRDRSTLQLPGRQEELILRLAALGKPLAVVLTGGSAVTMQRWYAQAPAILSCWYPGEQGGAAVADVLFGDYNPAGRLPITFPLTEGQLPLLYHHKPTGRNDDYLDSSGEALFPFGFGLSYTSFEYGALRIEPSAIGAGDSARVTLRVENTGAVAGEEVVQLYIRDLYASVARPLKELKGCARIRLNAGESRALQFLITPDQLSMPDAQLKRVVEPGAFRILLGASSKDIRLRGTLTVREGQ